MEIKEGQEVYIILSPGGGIGINIFSGKGTAYADKRQAERELESKNDWAKAKGYGEFSLITLEVR